MCGVYDVFKLELQGKLMACCVRVDADAVQSILQVSGKSWLLCHPLAHQNGDFPTVWAGDLWPDRLDVLYSRAQDLGALGLSVGDRHIGYRCTKLQEPTIRASLGCEPTLCVDLRGDPCGIFNPGC